MIEPKDRHVSLLIIILHIYIYNISIDNHDNIRQYNVTRNHLASESIWASSVDPKRPGQNTQTHLLATMVL